MQKSVNGKKFLSGNYFSQEENIVFPVGESVFLMRDVTIVTNDN